MAAGVASRGRIGASYADREQVIEALKDAFVHGRLTRAELGMRAGRALAARTHAELAFLTADIPVGAAGPATPATPGRRPLVRAAASSGGCLAFAFAILVAGGRLDRPGPGPGPGPGQSWASLCVFVALAAVIAAVYIVAMGVAAWDEERVSRQRQRGGPPPRRSPPPLKSSTAR
jgi:hypothetical protein